MRRLMGIPAAAVLLTACVTINVYFPAAEAKEAAKEFVEKVIGDEAKNVPPKPSDGGGMALTGLIGRGAMGWDGLIADARYGEARSRQEGLA